MILGFLMETRVLCVMWLKLIYGVKGTSFQLHINHQEKKELVRRYLMIMEHAEVETCCGLK